MPRLVTWVGLSILFHVLLTAVVWPLWPWISGVDREQALRPISLVLELPPQAEPEPEPDDPVQPDGQVVDVPRPDEEQRPEDPDYLAEYDRVVEEEMRSPRFRINPEIMSDQYTREDKVQFEEAVDLNVTDPSTGAKVGNDRFDPDRHGRLASVPSPFAMTNKDGLQRPVPASSRAQSLAGSPNNDLVDLPEGERLLLNTKEYVGAEYINRIKRLVSFYWSQNIDNLPGSLVLAKPRYTTLVSVVLDSNGALEMIEVTQESGSSPIDNAVIEAFRIAGPFPNPPEQLISRDGRVYLDKMGFTVELGQARMMFRGVDPRAGVQFPGILKATR